MKPIKIYRRGYLRLNQSQLVDFAANVLQRCEGKPEYQALESDLTALKAATSEYAASLAESVHGGKDRVARKNMAQLALLEALQNLCLTMEYHRLTAAAIIDAGLEPVGNRQMRLGALARPENVEGRPTGASGEIEVTYTLPDAGQVRTNAIEWSADGGEHWNNGHYSKRGRVAVNGLPRRQEVQLRVCSIGTRGRRSVWTEPVTVFVT